jgi:hypothetical protein
MHHHNLTEQVHDEFLQVKKYLYPLEYILSGIETNIPMTNESVQTVSNATYITFTSRNLSIYTVRPLLKIKFILKKKELSSFIYYQNVPFFETVSPHTDVKDAEYVSKLVV